VAIISATMLLHKPIMRLSVIGDDEDYFEDDCNGDDKDLTIAHIFMLSYFLWGDF
jgi:hypothetical protein